MKIFDVSVPVSKNMISWPGDPSVELSKSVSIAKGDLCNVTNLCMGVHSGTHIDAPYHFIESGDTVDAIDIELLIGDCLVIEVDVQTTIEYEDIRSYNIHGYTKILFKTKNSTFWKDDFFHKDFISLGMSAAKYLVENNIGLIGIDYLSIESFNSKDASIHKFLLEKNVIILEGLNLANIKSGRYELICMPLKLIGTDGAPARVVLKSLEN
ncbi:cyclase family protein [Sulfurimonas sp. HSL-1716]|uniref:cyclase family protein n=1 Tax=Hydrocurvibacter sulfurireducens TaxID=3131937 RepID=UPI0031F9EB08